MIKSKLSVVCGLLSALCISQNTIAASCTCSTVDGQCEEACKSASAGCSSFYCESTDSTWCTQGGFIPSSCGKGLGTDCTGKNTDWADVSGTNYQSKQSCSGITGAVSTWYRCKAGYYGDCSSCSTIPLCTRCPSYYNGVTTTYGTTANAGATSATECYISSGGRFSDDAGSGTYTSNCYWSE